MKVSIKPLSVNKCWQGKRFKTKDYKNYETELLLKLKNIKISSGKLKLNITFGYSNVMNDIDNGLKPFIDILQKKYKFNDRYIYELNVKKEIVKKGQEFIEFEIYEI